MINTLYNTEQSKFKYIIKASGLSIVLSLILSIVLLSLIPGSGHKIKGDPVNLFIAILLLSPILEILVMWPIIYILGLKKLSSKSIALSSAAIWGNVFTL